MKIKTTNYTYLGYLHKTWYNNEGADEDTICNLLSNFKQASNVNCNVLPILFIIDYSKKSYLQMSQGIETIANYRPQEFIEGGLQKTLDIIHKDDFAIYNQNIFNLNLNFLKETPQSQHHQYIFSCNYRMQCLDKSYANLLQRSSYITCKKTGVPLYCLGASTDVTNLKSFNNIISHTIERVSEKNGLAVKQLVDCNHFYTLPELSRLSSKEKSILNYIADGLSSKMIAYKLHISPNTVTNHRQNIMRKTNTKNVAQLVAYAAINNLI